MTPESIQLLAVAGGARVSVGEVVCILGLSVVFDGCVLVTYCVYYYLILACFCRAGAEQTPLPVAIIPPRGVISPAPGRRTR